ncbi:hypothetical protein SDC9_197504 [bioreactor metagenome]|uniref:Uncharacterized protein n=1 Tax=bioreactor metagenome TaxID=1076179 RepID=A0A645IFJ4_9ZZZZ
MRRFGQPDGHRQRRGCRRSGETEQQISVFTHRVRVADDDFPVAFQLAAGTQFSPGNPHKRIVPGERPERQRQDVEKRVPRPAVMVFMLQQEPELLFGKLPQRLHRQQQFAGETAEQRRPQLPFAGVKQDHRARQRAALLQHPVPVCQHPGVGNRRQRAYHPAAAQIAAQQEQQGWKRQEADDAHFQRFAV